MRALVLPGLLLLAGCVVYEQPITRPLPPPEPPPAPARRIITQRQAVDIAFGLCADRGLAVNRVHHAHLDSSGRWHVELRGAGDRARMLLDGRDGRLIKGRFRDRGAPRDPDLD
jgi:hypothetical protein